MKPRHDRRHASQPLRKAAELRRKCPSCHSAVPVADRVCRFCRADIRAHVARRVSTPPPTPLRRHWLSRLLEAVVGPEAV